MKLPLRTGQVVLREKLQYDLYYLRRQTPFLDIQILIRTLRDRGENGSMTVLVSVIVPARNEEVGIEGALRSIAAKANSTNCIEVVVVDGDLHDATTAVST